MTITYEWKEILCIGEQWRAHMSDNSRSGCIYLNNAATSWPKPPEVLDAISRSLLSPFTGGGRSTTRDAIDYIWSARSSVADLLGAREHEQVLFSHNATDALNTLILGFLATQKEPIHVLTSILEHNSVLRPLHELERAGRISLTVLPLDGSSVNSEALSESIFPDTRLAVLTHGSNVLGSVQNLKDMGKILHDNEVFFIADGAQTAGHIPITVSDLPVDAYVFTGHKALFGIPGTGGFILQDPEQIAPVRFGGTGSDSSSLLHPRTGTEKFEAGTHNFPGLAALSAGISFIQKTGLQEIEKKGIRQTGHIITQLRNEPNVVIDNHTPELPIISLNIEGLDNDDLGFILTRKYQIINRSGLHCAPLVHQAVNGGKGSVRLSLSWFTTDEECDKTIQAISEVAKSANHSFSQA